MKTLFFLAFIFMYTPAQSQQGVTFQLNSSWNVHTVVLNGDSLHIDSNFQTLPTRYPAFDTLYLDGWGPVLCNFKPDSSYTLIIACCGTVDIIQTSKWNQWRQVLNAHPDSLFDVLDVQPYLIDHASYYMQLEGTTTDTVYGWYADYSCYPTIQRVSSVEPTFVPVEKCFYWSNINVFEFFTSDKDYLEYALDDGSIPDIFRETGEWDTKEGEDPLLGSIVVRLFDDGRFLIRFNLQTEKVTLERL